MTDKFNLEGFSVDTDGKCTAEGGFVTQTSVSGAATLTGREGFVLITDDVTVAIASSDLVGTTLTIKRKTAKGSSTATFLGTTQIDGQNNTVTMDSKEYVMLIFGPGSSDGLTNTWNVISTDADISLV